MNRCILLALLRDYNNPASKTYRSPIIARVIAEQMNKGD
jgi:hypothetical protein